MSTSQPAIQITQATIEDLEELIPLFDGYRQFYRQVSDIEGARAFLTQHFQNKSSVIFVARLQESDGSDTRACGFTQLYPSFSSVSMKRLWILNDLFVAPGARKKGVGPALLDRARDFAAQTGARGLTLTTARDNYTAQSTYEANGWLRDEEFYSYHFYFA
ncbi:GNAT family N-acetyltransferase [Ktedonospora formicarum]|uniref:N-acetyltransferase n=1 Tax=Ktedonospora formicarum TaxID=2778364 RepID=A0A8J3HYQ5_9CHLR|nr:GNAT family N-acetyltransferase [Ktedonospora formicarum]GHO43087.1 N-acetyltransferase [Ktedonospora formicarum]